MEEGEESERLSGARRPDEVAESMALTDTIPARGVPKADELPLFKI